MSDYSYQSSLAVDPVDVDSRGIAWRLAARHEINGLLVARHYLGPVSTARLIHAGFLDGRPVAAQVWRFPAARHLPNDGSWLELARWCLTKDAGPNAGSRQHRRVARLIRETMPGVTTFVSYSDPSVGHTGSLYRACNWTWHPTWHRLRPPPTGGGSWDGVNQQAVKDRWVFALRPDDRRPDVLSIKDGSVLRRMTEKGAA